MQTTIDDLLKKADAASDRLGTGEVAYDLKQIRAAYDFARENHEGQNRKSGEPYIMHPLAVADILLDYNMDTDTIVSSLLHDVVEDTDVSLDEIRRRFGQDVAFLVDGVTKIGRVPLLTDDEAHAENIRKILIAMSKDPRVIVIKLADRLHNMRTLSALSPEKQRKIAKETITFYAPIARRCGIHKMSDEMGDLALFYLDKYAYDEIEAYLNINREERERLIENIQRRISEQLTGYCNFRIEGRVKSHYGIYKKVYLGGKTFDELWDTYAVRIIISDSTGDAKTSCYNVLGLIHSLFVAVPGRFKDYISTPKANGYRSLHTTVMSGTTSGDRKGLPFEVQIRTERMQEDALYGIAAHWQYKDSVNASHSEMGKTSWINLLIRQQQESADPNLLTQSIKDTVDSDEIYVFTPKGEVKILPKGSTVIDFAYAIHTQVGHRMQDAKTGGKITGLDYELQTGDMVEIRTSKSPNAGPKRSWLEKAKTSEARSKIQAWFKKERRAENIEEGKKKLDGEIKRAGLEPTPELLKDLTLRQRLSTVDDLYAAIGYGGVLLSSITPKLLVMAKTAERATANNELKVFVPQKRRGSGKWKVVVNGDSDIDIHLANCCGPLPGDDIVGFVTRLKGITVHRADCHNLDDLREKSTPDRWVNVSWDSGGELYDNGTYDGKKDRSFVTTIDVVADDRIGLLYDVTGVFMENGFFISESSSRTLKNGNGLITTKVKTSSTKELTMLIEKLKKVSGVITVERV
ncbi:MAG: bifunctional (p)ppGpp synthetase/guanosine-3',5'-bis(diphosphate) 3'-pyrophosphohydrolase [Oscillospiraceae bacterium]|jgi:GTP pyrophosphokinase|nr:bifunctional (p)ppGpp synthetase/guanosine-3',5'-bis(diphosphate) 3'-pyrophosphohydrolase [Oscillospiraceae bacterium]